MSGYNLSVVARALAFVGLVTIGQAALMILGEIDLSLGVIGGLCGVAAGILMVNYGINPWLAMPIALALGAFYGFLNGGLVSFLRLHSMVLTIGTAGIFGGINLVLTRGLPLTSRVSSISGAATCSACRCLRDHAGSPGAGLLRDCEDTVRPLHVCHRQRPAGCAHAGVRVEHRIPVFVRRRDLRRGHHRHSSCCPACATGKAWSAA